MADYLKTFATQADYDAYIAGNYDKPNVSYIEATDETIFTNYEDGPEGPDSTLVGIKNEDWSSSQTTWSIMYAVKEVYIPSAVTTLTGGAFYNTPNLEKADLSDSSVTELLPNPNNPQIGMFRRCYKLTDVILPSTLTTIGAFSFCECTALEEITLPSSVTTFNNTAIFLGCTSLRSVDMSDTSITTFYNQVISPGNNGQFQGCTALENVYLPSELTNLGAGAFYGCSKLETIELPSTLTVIGGYSFFGCSKLNGIDIPSGVTSIGGSAFNGCSALTSVTVRATTPPTLGQNAFGGTSANLVIYVPAASVEDYKAASGWSDYASQIQAIPSE